MSKERDYRALRVTDARAGKQHEFDGVVIEVVEVNRVKNPFGSDTYTVAYRIRDVRQSPVFVSQVAHLFVGATTDLMKEFRKVRDHYEEIKSMLRGSA